MHDLSLYLLEMLENSIRADATRVDVGLGIDKGSDRLWLTVDDNGHGLTSTPTQALDPFYTTKPGKKTGLGLSLLKAEAEAAEGGLEIGSSESLGGTRVTTFMKLSHIDRLPLGDIATSIVVMAATNPQTVLTVSLWGDEFEPPLDAASVAEGADRLTRYMEGLVA